MVGIPLLDAPRRQAPDEERPAHLALSSPLGKRKAATETHRQREKRGVGEMRKSRKRGVFFFGTAGDVGRAETNVEQAHGSTAKQ